MSGRRNEDELRIAALETALEQSKAAYEALFVNTVHGVVHQCASGEVIAANPAAERILGLSLDQMTGRTSMDPRWHATKEDGSNFPGSEHPAMIALQTNEVVQDVLMGVFNPQLDEYRWININAVPETRPGETAPFQVFVTFEDVTERRAAQKECQRLAQAVDQSAENIVITDADGVIEYVNPSFERASGYARAECIGKTPRLIKSGRHGESFYRGLWQTINSGHSWRGRMVNKKSDGTEYTEDGSISPVLDASGEVTSFVSVRRDVSETLAVAEEKEELRALLLQSQKMESIGRLAGGVAHDFNNLLAVINGVTDEVIEMIDGGETAEREDLEMIREAGTRATDLTRQLLTFSRKEAVSRNVLCLSEVVEALVPMIRRLVGEHIEVQCLTKDKTNLLGDSGQIEQILMNMSANARDAMPEGGRLAFEVNRVDLDPEFAKSRPNLEAAPYVVLTVADSGVGLDEQTQERIFEPFFTTKSGGRTGLGLATVFGIVKQAGGDVEVQSKAGQGTTFRIYFPATDASASRVEETSMANESGTEKVLVVDDDSAVRRLVGRQLSSAGYTVVVAADGQEALRHCEHLGDSLQLVVTDVVMPGMGGRELARRIHEAHQHLKILFMSGWAEGAVTDNNVLDDLPFIAKPFSSKQIRQAARKTLDSPS